MKHTDELCVLKEWTVPRFIEVCPYTESLFASAMARELVAVGPPMSDRTGIPSSLSQEGLSFISWWCDDPATLVEHFRPPSKFLARAKEGEQERRSAASPLGLS